MKNTIAVCIACANEEFQTDSLKAIYTQARLRGLVVQVFNTFEELKGRDMNNKGEASVFDRIKTDDLCGMILFCEKIKDDEVNQRLIEQGKKNGIPVVSVDRRMENCYNIIFDYVDAFEVIVRHLFDVHGCRSVFVMGGIRGNDFSEDRISVVRKVMAEYGLELKEEDIAYGDFWEGPCRREMQKFLDSKRPLPDAFIAANDNMAIVICEMLHKAGYKVPGDTIVTGFDGIEEEKYNTPRLTTSQQDIIAGGREAVETIWKVMQGQKTDQEICIPFAVRFSQSCGCLPVCETEASEKVHELYHTLKLYMQFSKYMYNMLNEMSGAVSIDGVLERLPLYLSLIESFRDVYLCVEGSYLDAYDDLNERIIQQNPGLKEKSDMEMILLAEWHFGKGYEIPLLHFSHVHPLPPERMGEAPDSLMFVPLHEQENVLGYLAVEFDPYANDYLQLWNFSVNLSHILDSVKSHQKMQDFNYELKKTNQKLEELYIQDPLTGIYNCRGFYQNIERCIKEHDSGWIMAVSVDLNGLKEINDTFGHSEGDFAIKTVGRALRECVGDKGICARFGGDEFSAAIFVDTCEPDAGDAFKERLLNLLEEINKASGKDYAITCSCGIYMTEAGPDTYIDELLREADGKMYTNKKNYYRSHGRMNEDVR